MTWLPASRKMCALCSCNSLQLFPSLGWHEVGNVLGIYFRLLQGNLCFAIPHVELWAQTSRCPGFRMHWNAWTSSSFLILTFQGPFGSQQQAWTPKFIGICNLACGGKCDQKGFSKVTNCHSLHLCHIFSSCFFHPRFQVICTTMHVGWPQRISGLREVPSRMARVFGFESTLR